LKITDLWGRYLPQADVRDEINGGAINAKISNVSRARPIVRWAGSAERIRNHAAAARVISFPVRSKPLEPVVDKNCLVPGQMQYFYTDSAPRDSQKRSSIPDTETHGRRIDL